MDYPICNLCKTNPATQENSHILPRFLKKEYLKTDKKFFLFNFSTKKSLLQQDLPKEDYILCPKCERRFQTLESIISLHLNYSYDYFKRKDYPIINLLDFDYQLFKKCNPKIFTLFVYSLVWRLHISNLPIYKAFILPDNCAEDLRRTLNKVVPENISDINNNLEKLENQRWHYIFVKPENRTKKYYNINYNGDIKHKNVSFIFIFEYVIVFMLSKTAVPQKFEYYVNLKFKEIKIMIVDNKTWNVSSIEAAKSMMKQFTPANNICFQRPARPSEKPQLN